MRQILIISVLSLNFFIHFFSNTAFSQVPDIEWQNSIGGSSNDHLYVAQETVDGGYILGASSISPMGYDKTENGIGGYITGDYWVLKTNSTGLIVWQNTIGGTGDDCLTTLQQTSDGGYIVGGYSRSNMTGDKTEPKIGYSDYWVLKLSSTGLIEWQNTIGGLSEDYLQSIMQTDDGGYILGGYSNSGLSGDKTEASNGLFDYWVVKLNSSGTIVWQNTIGGSNNDKLFSVKATSDGGFILGGYSESGISGDKSELALGFSDYWVVKLNSSGTIVWQNTIGGSSEDFLSCLDHTIDGGYILGGYSGSGLSGDKTEVSPGSYDYWIVKLNNLGNIVWQNTIGGSSADYLKSLQQGADGGYILGGYSNSNTSGDKIEPAYWSGYDYWIVKVDNSGALLWQNTIGSIGTDSLTSIGVTSDGGYILGGDSWSGNHFDKTEPSTGGSDLWILKIEPDNCIPAPYYFDIDDDGIGNGLSLGNTCQVPLNCSFLNTDCSEIYNSINPAAVEICDDLDNDCDGLVDEGIIDCNPGPGFEWQNTIGGINTEQLNAILQTSDGGYILGGSSLSAIGGDKTETTLGGNDYWVVKLSSTGTIEWQNTIGGNSEDILRDIEQTTDGGYILCGYSSSGISGDKTELAIGGSGFADYWVVKLNATGSIIWQNTIGANATDQLHSIQQTSDGGYILGGYSNSNITVFDKTEPCLGNYDYWVVKLNSTGIIVWQNTIGGSSDDRLFSIAETSDGGYILGGNSSSPISGDKTEAAMGDDYWVIKLDVTGAIIWQNTVAATGIDWLRTIIQTSDGGYLAGGYSYSNASGDKSENAIGVGYDECYDLYGLDCDHYNYADYWIIKLNTLGAIEWENTIGGNGEDQLYTLEQTSDGGYLLGGSSNSETSFDKTEGNNGIAFVNSDYWILKLDSKGAIQWQNTIGGTGSDELYDAIQTTDGGFLLGGRSDSGITDDKTEIRVGSFDYWIIKLEAPCFPVSESCNSLDDNCNGLIDDGVNETISISAAGPLTFCSGSNVTLNATYTGETVQWKRNGINITGATSPFYIATTKATYTCETTSDCDTEISTGLFVNVLKNPASSITAGGATTFCFGGSVVLSANAGVGLTYQWFQGAVAIAGATSINYTATTASTYKCKVTKTATGCNKLSNGIVVTVPCRDENELTSITDVLIYPNPAENIFTISAKVENIDPQSITTMPFQPTKIEIFTHLGQLIYFQQINSPQAVINETIKFEFPPGIYFIKLNMNGYEFIEKLILQ